MSTRWPYNIVYYTIAGDLPLSSKTRVQEAINYWKANSRIKFVVRTTQPNYVTFRPGSGCSSNVGMKGGQQFINVASSCSKGNIIHEINHALITQKNGTTFSVQRTGLSAGDKAPHRTMYHSKAALHSGPKTYFFSGDQYIRVTRGDTGPGTIDPGYPKHISTWTWPSSFRW